MVDVTDYTQICKNVENTLDTPSNVLSVNLTFKSGMQGLCTWITIAFVLRQKPHFRSNVGRMEFV